MPKIDARLVNSGTAGKAMSGRAPKTPGRSGVDRREEIAQIAARRFAEFGFRSTTIREIAADASILSGSIYHHFDTKEEILHDIIRDTVTRLVEAFERVAALDVDPETKTATLIATEIDLLAHGSHAAQILYNERKLFLLEEGFAYVSQAQRSFFGHWRDILAEGVRTGHFHGQLDNFLTASTITRIVNSCADWYRQADRYSAEQIPSYGVEDITAYAIQFVLGAVRHHDRVDDPLPRPASMA